MKLIRSLFSVASLSAVIAISILSSCDKLKDDEKDNVEISSWIYEWMQEVYFWNNTFPSNINIKTKTEPKAFFYELVYETEDRWSYITDDYETLQSELSGTPVSMGYSPAFGVFMNTNKVFIIVEYVYPNSPASDAGLKRGDIILTINGAVPDTDNYFDLYSQSSYTVGLGTYVDNTIYDSGKSISMTAALIEADPLIYDTVYTVSGKRIGYMVYTEFITGDDNQYLASLDQVFDKFKSYDITDLVIDLRYNPGGEIEAATYLASAIAPVSVANNSRTFVTFLYNENLQSYYEDTEGPESDDLVCKFPANAHNLDLNHVYFLTTKGTASASELLMIGLSPYMDVTVVGESTFGKYTGSWLIYDFETPRKHNWAIMPIVMKYANAEGYTNFVDGLAPDYAIEDNLIAARPFGDASDPVLSRALDLITASPYKTTKSTGRKDYMLLDNPVKKMKSRLIIPQ
ncbi:MAG: PDZ domain-containing protein [Bacteroidales bacterium]|nr:PDZ domain-containing protein [Bacteroidales bacterium]